MLDTIFENNKKWVKTKLDQDPEFFDTLAKGQKPEYLFIGCADSRVPANEITGTGPGEMFVHRNIANLVVHTDINLLSVLQYAVEVLKVENIIVCGHYGCGGVAAAMSDQQFGLIDNWLRNIKDIIRIHYDEIVAIKDEEERQRKLVEINVIEQVYNLSKTSIVQNAKAGGQTLNLHGLVYDIKEGFLKDLQIKSEEFAHFESVYSYQDE